MPAIKKKKPKGKPKGTKPKRSPNADDTTSTHDGNEKRSWSSSSLIASAATFLGGAALAIAWNRYLPQTAMDSGNGDAAVNMEGDPTSKEGLLARVRRSRSFDLVDKTNRTLVANTDISSGTVLMEIPRELMIWDLDAARDEFIQNELFRSPLFGGDTSDTMTKRAALLAAYLALLRNEVVPPSDTFPLQATVARALPSYEEYAAFHPILADLTRLKKYLGKKSVAFLHLVHARKSFDKEYDMLGAKFATHVSREDYFSCRLAVGSRSFQITNIPEGSELSKKERVGYKQKLGIDFSAVVSIEPVIDWMNGHTNNNVKVGGYDAKKRSGQAWAIRTIHKGQELINNYGQFYDHVLFSQYGFIPSDGTGTTIASLFVHHDVDLMGEINETNPTLPPLEKMASYLRYDYGYNQCITKESHPEAFAFKRLKLNYLQQIAIDPSRWVLPLPPRSSTDDTPISTTTLPSDYTAPSFGVEVYEYLEANALSASLPCRLISLTDTDLDDGTTLLQQDLQILRESATPHHTPLLRLEELEISISWFIRTVQCMKKLTTYPHGKNSITSVSDQENYIMDLVKDGNINTLEWNAAHVKLEEMQSQEAMEDWAMDVLDRVKDIESVSADDYFVREEPCPEEYTRELILN